MSKNIVDAILEFSTDTGYNPVLIATRRQIDGNRGYVNNWSTREFCEYVRSKTAHVQLQRDHAGPGQGLADDDGYESLREDCQFFDRIHIDPWKKYPRFDEGLKWTSEMIRFCHSLNPMVKYEVGTEEAIRRFQPSELDEFLFLLQQNLGSDLFKMIDYAVIQSGTSLKGNTQTGNYEPDRLDAMVKVCRKHGILSKEHNGDYIPSALIREKLEAGLDSINIAPELGLTETDTYLDAIHDTQLREEFWKICYESKRWTKWVHPDFDPFERKTELIRICGHYVFSDPVFIEIIKNRIPGIDREIKIRIRNKLENFL